MVLFQSLDDENNNEQGIQIDLRVQFYHFAVHFQFISISSFRFIHISICNLILINLITIVT